LTINISDSAMDLLGDIGFDPVYGARPLKRAIALHLENELATRLLQGKYLPGSTIHIDSQDDALVFT